MENQKTFPKELLPSCWDDDTRMGVLFSPFRERSVNKENYDGKMLFWEEMIAKYCQWKGQAQVTVQEVEEAARRNEKKPYCLEKVFEEMLTNGKIQKESDFEVIPPRTWPEWGKNLMKKPVKWSGNKVQNWFSPQKFTRTVFIVTEVVEIHADKVAKLFENQIVSRSQVINVACKELNLSAKGVSLAIHALHCEQKVAMRSVGENKEAAASCDDFVLKFASTGERIQDIPDLDFSIYKLEMLERTLTKIIDQLEEEAQKEGEKAREHVKKSEKGLALLSLKKKKRALRNLEQRTNSIMNIQEMLEKIHNVKLDKQIMQAYQMGGKSLQDVLKEAGITREIVEDTLDEMRDTIGESNMMQDALAQDVVTSSADAAELEQELEDLLKEDIVAKQDDDIINRMEGLKVIRETPSPESSRGREPSSQY
ncbi:hypothetical protein DMENIID0001_022890 [Sergentomyia squamirostris]